MEYKLVDSGVAMPTGDKQQPLSVKKVALRDLPNETRNIITTPQGSSLIRAGSCPDTQNFSGMKRNHPDWLPSSLHQSACNTGTNGHLVYVRRKLEDTGKPSTSGPDMTATISRKLRNNEGSELSCQQDQVQEPRVSCFPALSPNLAPSLTISSQGPSVPSVGLPTNGLLAVEPSPSMFSTSLPAQSCSPSSCSVHWKERFLRLQTFLNKCDESTQEEYILMLRSLSAVGRSKHAVELEKRAIHLLLEEGKELRRMKLLNVLGKVSPN